jgi:uncharacterized protein (DUF2336 family)
MNILWGRKGKAAKKKMMAKKVTRRATKKIPIKEDRGQKDEIVRNLLNRCS